MRISVRSIPKKFWRAGLAFTEKPRTLEVDEKTCEILKAERMLVVEVLPDAPAPDGNIGNLTVAQLMKEISEYQPVESLMGTKKAELVEILKTHREAAQAE